MYSAALRWELSRLAGHRTMLLLFGSGVSFAVIHEAFGGADAFFPALLLSGAMGAVAAADAGAFSRHEEGMHDLAFLMSRPLGRLPVFLFRLGLIATIGVLLWAGTAIGCRFSGLGTAWVANWTLSLTTFGFAAMAQLGMLTEPKLELRERLHRRSFLLKLLPPTILGSALWMPYLTGAIDLYDRGGPTQWWMRQAPTLSIATILVLGLSYGLGLARDWNRAEITS